MGLDLFGLLVENVFGSILLSGLGISAILFFIGIIGRMSIKSVIIIVGIFLAVFATGYIGALAAVPIFIGVFIYFVSGLINYFSQVK